MKRWPANHLTADDLDAFHAASLTAAAKEHLEACEECRTMALLDRALLDALAALPSYAPRPEFAERVMARVRRPEPAAVRRLIPRTRAVWVKAAVAASVVVSLGASIVWSLFNRELLLSWINTSAAETGRTIWLGVRMVATNLTAQPWYDPLREFASSPGRLAAVGSGVLVIYGAAVYAMRRLLTPPSRPVPHAHG
jgi:predicted anti-sigma-YlaC factor YlaD